MFDLLFRVNLMSANIFFLQESPNNSCLSIDFDGFPLQKRCQTYISLSFEIFSLFMRLVPILSGLLCPHRLFVKFWVFFRNSQILSILGNWKNPLLTFEHDLSVHLFNIQYIKAAHNGPFFTALLRRF